MKISLLVFDDEGDLVKRHDYDDNPLALLEMSIELFEDSGGEVRYKIPEEDKGERFFPFQHMERKGNSFHCKKTRIFGPGHSSDKCVLSGYRLTLTPPPKPEPVESELDRLRVDAKKLPSSVCLVLHGILDKIDELEKAIRDE